MFNIIVGEYLGMDLRELLDGLQHNSAWNFIFSWEALGFLLLFYLIYSMLFKR